MTMPKNKKLPGNKGGGRPNVHQNDNNGDKPGNGIKKNGNGPILPKLPKFYGGKGGYKGVNTKTVRRLTGGVLRDELNDLRRQRRMVRRESRNDAIDAKNAYKRGKQDLRHVYGESTDYLNFLRNQNQQMYSDQQNQSQAATAALQAQLGGTYSGAQQGAMDELARLGISQGGNFSQLQSDAANQQALAQQSGANAQSTMGLAAQNSDALAGLLQGMNQGQMVSDFGKNLNARNDALADVRQNKMDQMNVVREAMSDARGSRRDLFFQLLQQLQQTGWDQFMDMQNLKLARRNK